MSQPSSCTALGSRRCRPRSRNCTEKRVTLTGASLGPPALPHFPAQGAKGEL